MDFKPIPQSSIENLIADLDSKVARKHIYADIATMILLANQQDQKAGELIRVTDASADANVASGPAYYDYTGAETQDLGDYFLVAALEGTSFSLTDGQGTTANGSAVDIGGGSNLVGNKYITKQDGNANKVIGWDSRAIIYYQDIVAGITNAIWTDVDFAILQSLAPGSLAATLYTGGDGYARTGNNGSGIFKGFRIKDASSRATIDFTGDAEKDYLIPDQARVQEMIDAGGGGHIIEDEGTPVAQQDTMNFVGDGVAVTDAGGKTVVTIDGGAPLETIQTLTVTDANYTDALVLDADTNVVEITLDATLTNDWTPSAITGWVVGRNYTWFIIKASDNGVDLTTARAVPNIGYDDDIDPFDALIDIDTTQQRAVVSAVGFKSTFGQFGRLIITDSGYVE